MTIRRGPDVASKSLLAATLLAAAIPWMRAYNGAEVPIDLVAASALPVLLGAVTIGWLGRKPALSFTASLGGLVVLLASMARFDEHSLVSALAHGPGRLLTETLPLSGRATDAPAVILVWLASAIASEIYERAALQPDVRGSGVPTASASLIAPVGLYVVSFVLTVSAPGATRAEGPLLLVLVAAAALAMHSATDVAGVDDVDEGSASPSTLRTPMLRAGCVACVLALTLGLAIPVVPGIGEHPVSLHEPPPLASGLIVDPVNVISATRDNDPGSKPHPLLVVRTDAPSTGYLAAAILDSFDGSEWSFRTKFEPTGGRIPTPGADVPGSLGRNLLRTSTSVVSALPVPLLPVSGEPLSVVGLEVAADPRNGMIAPDEPVHRGSRFTVESLTPEATLAELPSPDGIDYTAGRSGQGATRGSSSALGSDDLALPVDSQTAVATAARFVSALTGERPTPTVAYLQQVLGVMQRAEKRIDPGIGQPTAPGRLAGTSLSQVIDAVTVNRSATPEQFATFFALLARYLGVPARLVTGFRISPRSNVTVGQGSYTITNRQAWTWVEVPVSGQGWVVADPTPDATTGVSSPPPEQVQVPTTTLVPPRAQAVPRDQASGGHAIARPSDVRVHPSTGLPGWALAATAAVGVAALLALAGPGFAFARRRSRTRSRISDDPSLLAEGAWLEIVDSLTRAGMEVPFASTTTEVSFEAGRHFGAGISREVFVVGAVADRAVFSILHPPGPGEAQAAWDTQRALSREIHRSLDLRQRARAAMLVGAPARRSGGEL